MASYDKHYRTQEYFGKPYPELMRYFDSFDRTSTIIDLGCGQGRDVLALGRMGFSVVGVDLSEVGIRQLNDVASSENLNVSGMVGDYNKREDLGNYDILLMDSMFHFYRNNMEQETKALQRVLHEMKRGARLVLVVQKDEHRIQCIKDIVAQSDPSCSVEHEERVVYEEFDALFHLLAIIKA